MLIYAKLKEKFIPGHVQVKTAYTDISMTITLMNILRVTTSWKKDEDPAHKEAYSEELWATKDVKKNWG